MWFWVIAGLVIVAVAILYWRSERKVKASGNSLGRDAVAGREPQDEWRGRLRPRRRHTERRRVDPSPLVDPRHIILRSGQPLRLGHDDGLQADRHRRTARRHDSALGGLGPYVVSLDMRDLQVLCFAILTTPLTAAGP